MAPAFQNTLTFNHSKKVWENLFSEVGKCSFTAAKKSSFYRFLTQNNFFASKMINHHDKQLTPSESWDQDGCFSLGLWYHHIQIIGLEIYNAVATKSGWTLGQSLKPTFSKLPELVIFGGPLSKSRLSATSATVFHANLNNCNI